MMLAEPAAPAMTDDDQRQLRSGDGAIHHAHQLEIGARRRLAGGTTTSQLCRNFPGLPVLQSHADTGCGSPAPHTVSAQAWGATKRIDRTSPHDDMHE
ncbi:MAG: hypothetical protein AB1586_02860 [Pseudomonadota bacterium]